MNARFLYAEEESSDSPPTLFAYHRPMDYVWPVAVESRGVPQHIMLIVGCGIGMLIGAAGACVAILAS